MWVASSAKTRLLGTFLALLGLLLVGWGGWYYGKQKGIVEGLTEYHHMCYHNGPGFIIIGDEAVVCSPAGKLSKKEMQELDKGIKTWYTK